MKNTYDQKDFIFFISDGKTKIQFEYVYGLDCEDTWRSLQFDPKCERFQLKACKNFSDAHINREKVSTMFYIPFCMDTTFEEATQAYLMEHLSEFRGNKLRCYEPHFLDK